MRCHHRFNRIHQATYRHYVCLYERETHLLAAYYYFLNLPPLLHPSIELVSALRERRAGLAPESRAYSHSQTNSWLPLATCTRALSLSDKEGTEKRATISTR